MNIKDEVYNRLDILAELGAIGINESVTKEIHLKDFFDFDELPISVNVYGIVGTIYKGHSFRSYKKVQPALELLKSKQCVPYYIMISGEIVSILFVSNDENKWKRECSSLKKQKAMAFCGLLGTEQWELGEIGFTVLGGGLVRTI